MREKEVIIAVKGDTEKFKRDLFNRLEKENLKDIHQIQERLEEIAKDIITDYIYFETENVEMLEEDSPVYAARNILERHRKAFIELAK